MAERATNLNYIVDMSWSKPQYGPRGQELNWMQSCMQSHDAFCGCNDPVSHLIKTALQHGGVLEFNKTKLKQLCHDTTETTTPDGDDTDDHTTGPEGDLDFGDLDKLFEEEDPFGEKDSG